ncbi:MAG: molybdopterin-dependent oxidoreductase [Archaeoglobaceae archaeon]
MDRRILVLITAAVLVFVIAAFLGNPGMNKPLDGAQDLEPVEIKQYEGEDLSSIDDFRENSIKGPQYINQSDYRLSVTGLVENPNSYKYEQVINDYKQYKKVITLHCVEGWSVKILWEGILVGDIIEGSHPMDNATVVIFHAHDDYTTSLPLDYVMDNDIMLAHKMNNVTLPAERGFPFELVAESKWGYKWIKWVTKIELSNDTDYRGFWESRGFSNEADVSSSFY